jgi:hypothetical protein
MAEDSNGNGTLYHSVALLASVFALVVLLANSCVAVDDVARSVFVVVCRCSVVKTLIVELPPHGDLGPRTRTVIKMLKNKFSFNSRVENLKKTFITSDSLKRPRVPFLPSRDDVISVLSLFLIFFSLFLTSQIIGIDWSSTYSSR